jgi:hypothetical protein
MRLPTSSRALGVDWDDPGVAFEVDVLDLVALDLNAHPVLTTAGHLNLERSRGVAVGGAG